MANHRFANFKWYNRVANHRFAAKSKISLNLMCTIKWKISDFPKFCQIGKILDLNWSNLISVKLSRSSHPLASRRLRRLSLFGPMAGRVHVTAFDMVQQGYTQSLFFTATFNPSAVRSASFAHYPRSGQNLSSINFDPLGARVEERGENGFVYSLVAPYRRPNQRVPQSSQPLASRRLRRLSLLGLDRRIR